MQLALMSYCFNKLEAEGRIDVFGYLETVRYRFGLGAADIWNGSLKSIEDSYLRKVKDGLDERGLVLANLAVDKAHIWEEDEALRERNHQNALAHLSAAEFLGARTVRIDCGGGREQMDWSERQFDLIVKRYREYCQRAYDNGYRVGPENHWGAAMAPASLKKLCQVVDHPAFGVLLHFGRWHGPDAPAGDGMLAPWAMHTHIWYRGDDAGLPASMATLRDAGYDGYWSVEYVSMRYAELGLRLSAVRDILDQWRT